MIKPNFLDACQALQPEDFFVIEGHQITHFEDNSGKGKPTKEAVEAKLKELEADYDAKSYARNRQQNFPNEHDLLVALWEKVMEDRSESADALQEIRTQVKSDNPKP